MYNLGNLYEDQRKWRAAAGMFEHAHAVYCKAYGEAHEESTDAAARAESCREKSRHAE